MAGFFNLFYQKQYKKRLFSTSFSEGNSLNILEIISIKKIEDIIHSELLISFNESSDKNIYRFASSDKEILITFSQKISLSNELESTSFSTA